MRTRVDASAAAEVGPRQVSCSYDYECRPSWSATREHRYYDDYYGEGRGQG
jgi:hypothetical protein